MEGDASWGNAETDVQGSENPIVLHPSIQWLEAVLIDPLLTRNGMQWRLYWSTIDIRHAEREQRSEEVKVFLMTSDGTD